MDELKLKLSTKFMRGIVAKLIANALYKKYGYEINICINEVEIKTGDNKLYLHANVDAEINKDEFASVIKQIGLG